MIESLPFSGLYMEYYSVHATISGGGIVSLGKTEICTPAQSELGQRLPL